MFYDNKIIMVMMMMTTTTRKQSEFKRLPMTRPTFYFLALNYDTVATDAVDT